MSAEMRSFMEAYGAVHNKEVKENLDKGKDSISEMNLSQLTDGDLCEIAEEVLEVMFAEGNTVAQSEAIVESVLVASNNPGRQAKIERLGEAFKSVFGRVKEKSARTAVESFALYRKGKSLQDNWSNKFSHENGNIKLHRSLVGEDKAIVKNGLLELYKGKHGQSDKEYADSRSPGGKMVSGDSTQSGAEYTHGRRVKAANPGMQPDVGGKTKPKSQGKMDAGTRADLQYRKANLKKEEVSQIRKDWAEAYAEVYVAEKSGSKPDFLDFDDDGNRTETMKKALQDKKNIRGNDSKEQKARLEKKRGMKLDDHPQFKEELEATGKFTAKEIEAIINKI